MTLDHSIQQYPNALNFTATEEAPVKDFGFAMLPGRVAVLMDRAGDVRNGVLLPASGRLNPNTGTVCHSGVDELKVGDRVAVRFTDGMWIEEDGWTLRLLGVADDWFTSIPLVNGRPAYDWVEVEREQFKSALETTPRFLSEGRVVSTGWGADWFPVGAKVWIDERAEFLFMYDGSIDASTVLVRAQNLAHVVLEYA